MNDQLFIITEHHPVNITQSDQAVRKIVAAWLTKELHK